MNKITSVIIMLLLVSTVFAQTPQSTPQEKGTLAKAKDSVLGLFSSGSEPNKQDLQIKIADLKTRIADQKRRIDAKLKQTGTTPAPTKQPTTPPVTKPTTKPTTQPAKPSCDAQKADSEIKAAFLSDPAKARSIWNSYNSKCGSDAATANVLANWDRALKKRGK